MNVFCYGKIKNDVFINRLLVFSFNRLIYWFIIKWLFVN